MCVHENAQVYPPQMLMQQIEIHAFWILCSCRLCAWRRKLLHRSVLQWFWTRTDLFSFFEKKKPSMAAYLPSSYSLVGTTSQLGMTWSILGWCVPVPFSVGCLGISGLCCGFAELTLCGSPWWLHAFLLSYVTAAYRKHCPWSCYSGLINSNTYPVAVRPPPLLLLCILLWVYNFLPRPPRLVKPRWHSIHFSHDLSFSE